MPTTIAQLQTTELGWQGDASVRQWLFAESFRFDFLQAVRLLEYIASHDASDRPNVSPGEGSDPASEAVHLKARVGFEFPPSELCGLTKGETEVHPPELTVNFFSLAGASAPLPDWVADLLQAQLRNRDTGLRDFLDIFHHRLLSLLYRAQMRHRLWLEWKPPGKSRQSSYILSFAGLGLPEVRDRLAIPDEDLLPYAGLLWQRPRSMAGLQRILAAAFSVQAATRQRIGTWRALEPDDWTRIGATGQNHRLGRTAILGKRVWDSQGCFEVTLGPLTFAQFEELLPGGSSYNRLRALVRLYVGDLLKTKLRLLLAGSDVPQATLGVSRLGWTSWLGKQSSPTAQSLRLTLR